MNSIPNTRIDLRHIRVNTVYKLLIFIVLIVPDDVFTLFAIYTNRTPSFIAYRWLNYSYNIVLLAILVLGIILSLYHNEKRLWILSALIIFREIVFWLFSENSCIADGSYEIYLTLFTGIALAKLAEYACEDYDELNRFFWTVIIANVMTVFLAVLLKAGYANRYNAINMDVGSTGTICSITVIYCLFNEKIKNRTLIALLSVVALFLSGSRVNLLLTVIMLAVGFLIRIFQHGAINKRVAISFIALMFFGFIGLIYYDANSFGTVSGSNVSIARMIASFSLDGMRQDSSVLGRTTSIGVGIDIIKNNPFGISGYFTNLQVQTVQRGFPTFPHSSLIDYYIFLGPIFILFIISVVKMLKRLFRSNYPHFMVLLYMFVFITLSGGPIVNFKIIFIYSTILIVSQQFSRIENSVGTETVDR